ncbi:hypothetical protein ALC57_13971 [Trachymyrmex cornetzi]|uniref:Uncharacterized protein n=1 Tax=Trachymyrmex cornetzi TaxID=471704 RepID=A0A195DM39_9HYME|nr:hypothetical protein ALC57_13971 [Trachymyrmex cornetzi]
MRSYITHTEVENSFKERYTCIYARSVSPLTPKSDPSALQLAILDGPSSPNCKINGV